MTIVKASPRIHGPYINNYYLYIQNIHYNKSLNRKFNPYSFVDICEEGSDMGDYYNTVDFEIKNNNGYISLEIRTHGSSYTNIEIPIERSQELYDLSDSIKKAANKMNFFEKVNRLRR